MSRPRRQRDELAPSLFPFLAVLLCTMGALVLILMLIVAGAQDTKQTAARETQMQVEEAQAQIELVKDTFNDRLREGRIELEKERLKLQSLESHISELLVELEELQRAAELTDEELSQDETQREEFTAELSELEKKLAEATSEWQQKLDKPEGDKPVFAIIPYQGTNGTHRRPIYVECTGEGVVLQPEGIVIPLADLQPPYGPGNPLDAALRTVRSEFPPRNGVVTSTAYPLLVVRPSGIKSYVMARAAMRGWDDQFGYELVEEELELAFPEATPGLKSKVATAIDLARQRQAALVMAMPQRFRSLPLAENFEGEWRSDGSGAPGTRSETDGRGNGSTPGSSQGDGNGNYAGDSSGQESAGAFRSGDPGAGLSSAESSRRGGFAFDPATGGALQLSGAAGSAAGTGGAGVQGFAAGESGETTLDSSNNAAGRRASSGRQAPGSSDYFASSPLDLQPSTGGAADSWDSFSPSTGGASAEQAGGAQAGNGPAFGQQPGQSSGQSGPQGASGPSQAGGSPGGAQGGSTPIANGQAQGSDPSSAASQSSPSAGNAPGLSVNAPNNSSRREASAAVAKTRGRNWAWSQGPPTDTPFIRSIHMRCLVDRWVLLPDSGSNKPITTISFDAPPRERAEQLAEHVAERVRQWGVAVTNGHWKPVLSVEVGPDAEWRYDQLRQLLDGSGLDVQRRPVKP